MAEQATRVKVICSYGSDSATAHFGPGERAVYGSGVYFVQIKDNFYVYGGGAAFPDGTTWGSIADWGQASSNIKYKVSEGSYVNASGSFSTITVTRYARTYAVESGGGSVSVSSGTSAWFDGNTPLGPGFGSSTATPAPDYYFDGWYHNGVKVTSTSAASQIYLASAGSREVRVSYTYPSDVSLTARFVHNPYTLTYNAGSTGLNMPQPQTAYGNVALGQPWPVPAGYYVAFCLCTENGAHITEQRFLPGDTVSLTAYNVIAVAELYPYQYTITLKHEETTIGQVQAYYNGMPTQVSDEFRNYCNNLAQGHHCIGFHVPGVIWVYGDGNDTVNNQPFAGTGNTYTLSYDSTAQAAFAPDKYNLIIHPNGGVAYGHAEPFVVTADLKFNAYSYYGLLCATRTGYTFLGYTISVSAIDDLAGVGWSEYVWGNGNFNTDASGNRWALAKQGHCWTADGNPALPDDQQTCAWCLDAKRYNNTVVTYAQWQPNPYTMYLRDGEWGTEPVAVPVTFDAYLPDVTPPAHDGYTFRGYSIPNVKWVYGPDGKPCNPDGTSAEPNTYKYETAGDLALDAQWRANTYTVKFDANGGVGAMPDMAFTYDAAQALTANAFTNTGCTFGGWATSAGGAAEYADGETVSNLTAVDGGTVTLYAVWNGTPYTVTLDLDGGMIDAASGPVMLNATYGSPLEVAKPEKAHYAFGGWSVAGMSGSGACWGYGSAEQPNPLAAPNDTIAANDAVYVKNLTDKSGAEVSMKAQWTRITSTVTVDNTAGAGYYALSVSGEGLDTPVSVAAGGTAQFTALAGAVYTVTATMAAESFANAIAYPLTMGAKAFGRQSVSGAAVFAATMDAIGESGEPATWAAASRTVTTSKAAAWNDPLGNPLDRTLAFADAATANVRVVAPETAGSVFLNWTQISPSTAIAQGYSADQADVVLRTSELSEDVEMTANWQAGRIAVSALKDAAASAVAALNGVGVSVTADGAGTVAYGDNATWSITGEMPEGYSFLGWHFADGGLAGTTMTLTRKVTESTALTAKFKSTLSVTWEADFGDAGSGDAEAAGYVIVAGVIVEAKPYSVAVTIGEPVALEAVAKKAVPVAGGGTVDMFFGGWYDGATHEGNMRLVLPAKGSVTAGASRTICAFFRNSAELHSVAIYSRDAATKEFDDALTFAVDEEPGKVEKYNNGSAYESDTGLSPLDAGAEASSAKFYRIIGMQSLVIDSRKPESVSGGEEEE